METSIAVRIRDILIANELAEPKQLRGCTKDEIQQLKTRQKVTRLPKVYEDFMLMMGKSAGPFLFRGEDYVYDQVLELKDTAIIEISNYAEDTEASVTTTFSLPDDAFVFFSHHCVYFYYFQTGNDSDDPPVYDYCEGDNRLVSGNLSAFYMDDVREWVREVEKRKRYGGWPI